MSKKKNNYMLCFPTVRSEKHERLRNFNGNNSSKNNISRSFHDHINYLDAGSVHSSNSSGHNGLISRPKPPPYDEYTSKLYSNGLIRSFSTYSASNDRSFYNDSTIGKESCEDSFSQYSESDPPKLIDEMSRATISENCVRPKSLRPTSPIPSKNSFNKHNFESQQSPSGDSGVRLTPNDLDQKMKKREYDIYKYLDATKPNGHMDQLKILQVVNNKLSMNEINNQNLINKATHFIEKLRQKLKSKNFEIIQLQNRLKEHSEKLKIKEIHCQQLELHLQQSCHLINTQAVSNANGNHSKEVSTQTSIHTTENLQTVDFPLLQQQFNEERAKWLEEKAQVISYHKQLNLKYQKLLEKNVKLENELLNLQQQLIFDQDIDSDTEIVDKKDFLNPELQGAINGNLTGQPSSRLVKFEESLC